MALEVEDKTEKPTERRRRLAREQGLGPRSAALTLACRMLGATVGFQWFGQQVAVGLSQLVLDSLQSVPVDQLTTESISASMWDATQPVALSMIGLVACVLVSGMVGQWLQVGFRMQPADVLPDVSRLISFRGFARLWTFDHAQDALFGLLKYLIVLLIGGWSIWSNLARLMLLTESDAAIASETFGSTIVTLAWQLTGIAVLFGLADYGVQVWKFEQSLKMSPQEIREEARQQSADPRWKEQRRELWRQSSRAPAVESVEAR